MISQFDGYEQLAEFDWDGYRSHYEDIGRLDLILAAEGELGHVRFQISCRNHQILVELTLQTMVLHLRTQAVPPIRVYVDDKTITMHAGHTYRFTLGTSGSGETIHPAG